MTSKLKNYIYLIIIPVFTFLLVYFFKDATEFMIFQARDLARAQEIFTGKWLWWGPEMSRGGQLPGPASYLLQGIVWVPFNSWELVSYWLIFLVSLGTAWLWWQSQKLWGYFTASLILILYFATPTGPIAALINLHPAYLLFFNPIIFFGLINFYKTPKLNLKYFIICFLVGLSLQFHLSALYWVIFLLLGLYYLKLPIKFYLVSLICVLLPLFPSVFSINLKTWKQIFGKFNEVIKIGHNTEMSQLSEIWKFFSYFEVFILCFLLIVVLDFFNSKAKKQTIVIAPLIKKYWLALLACLVALWLELNAGTHFEVRYLLVNNFVLILGIGIYAHLVYKKFQITKRIQYSIMLINLFLALSFWFEVYSFYVVPHLYPSVSSCERLDYPTQDLTNAKRLEQLSKLLKENTNWSYQDFVSRAVLIGYKEVNVGFKPIFENNLTTNLANNKEVAGLILADRRYLCKKNPSIDYYDDNIAIAMLTDLIPMDLLNLFEQEQIRIFKFEQIGNTLVYFYKKTIDAYTENQMQNVGLAYNELNYYSDSFFKDTNNLNFITWNNCDKKYADCILGVKYNILKSASKCYLDFTFFGKSVAYNEGLYSPDLIANYKKIKLNLYFRNKRKSITIAENIGYDFENFSSSIRAPITKYIEISCAEADPDAVSVSYELGAILGDANSPTEFNHDLRGHEFFKLNSTQ